MPLNKVIRDGDNQDLTEERLKSTFDTDEMAAIIWEGKERVRRRREITKKVNEHTELHDPYSQAFMTRHEEIENAARKITKMVSQLDEFGIKPTDVEDMVHLTSEVIGVYGHPLALHHVMFIPALQAQCADDQMHWLQLALSRQIIGTYAQTELGHGKFLAQALTTAIRYSAVRRQGEILPGKGEVKILEYQTQQHRLLPQLARAYLMKAAEAAQNGRALGTLVDYLVKPSDNHSTIDRQPDHGYSAHLKAFDKAAKLQVKKAYERMRSLRGQGLSKEDAWNANAVELNRAARVHTRQYIAHKFHEYVHSLASGPCREVLFDLLHLHLNYELLDMAYYLLEDGYLSGQQMDYMKEDMYRLLEKLRPNAVSLVDSWDISDHELRSVLGRRDGHVYENLYKWAQESELNRTQVLPTFEKYLKPMMKNAREQSKL
ncbi:hypothetical protein GCK32_009612 [Trichostrongylus colubriformis]|uniref:Uncharacterized protein n=1 Tax=Trichostrongylus colubriformis TaxID=6319 RepID=A0AAN8FR81_TRICO